MSEELRSRVAAQIRRDLADEMEAGFPLMRRFPNSEMAGIPDFVSRLSTAERESMLDALALYATLQWDREKFLEKRNNPAIPRLGRPQPRYPDGDWYGGRPKKATLKRAVAEKLVAIGFVPCKREKAGSPNWLEFMHPDSGFPGTLGISFDPGFPRQLDYGYRNWLKPDLLNKFPPLGPRDIIPAITNLNYEVLWRCEVASTAICWDVITEANIEQTLETFVETLDRLYRLAARINALEVWLLHSSLGGSTDLDRHWRSSLAPSADLPLGPKNVRLCK
jgi:hypothetical protein